MKKLQLNQMENLEGGVSPRNCLYMGAGIALLSLAGGALYASTAAMGVAFGGAIGGFFTAASNDCF